MGRNRKAASLNWTTQPTYREELLILCNALIGENRYELVMVVSAAGDDHAPAGSIPPWPSRQLPTHLERTSEFSFEAREAAVTNAHERLPLAVHLSDDLLRLSDELEDV